MSSAPLATADGLVAELQAELKDHAYGLQSFTTPCHEGAASSGPQASAAVVLLEGVQVTIVLDASGYTVANGGEKRFAGTTFETLTGLLAAVSAEFNGAMHRCLSAKLIQAMDADDRLKPDSA
ncbi:hypothetical protein IW140_006556 [Coemansia sp. RSA 1813]|nr:hypothetical protein EV178_006497 [Coemansia sp. RSA 1646]KAJ1764729.1 hypothetical protein LPJ74_006585 [Coemansia sp. RSA 1843]KAJ2085048.1 hypothetical protein IW138_006505 [Coemansia sp. RSA 986]KAJ2210093.1 hypothetical protein EV179_006438 [Coemansia sp. RSA 487]KAJ2561594.1 hypothetical protein IW140_006556 [Coemansia sp. RSA 1813]